MPDLSVVIPTCGRDSLITAVISAARQLHLGVEVIVVDASGAASAERLLKGLGDVRIVNPNRPLSPGEARQLGSATSQGDWIAFLDDDDIFLPDKCATQVSAAVVAHADLVTSDFAILPYSRLPKRSQMLSADWGRIVAALLAASAQGPKERPRSNQRLARYLFERRSLRSRHRLVTSSWLLRGDVAREIQWNPRLERFEDWDYLLRLEQVGVGWVHVPESLVGISIGSPRSLSSFDLTQNAVHMVWPIPRLADTAPRPLGDLLTCDIGVTFAKSGDTVGAYRAFRIGRIVGAPGWQATTRLVGAIGAAKARKYARWPQRDSAP